jgi:hypothetical protein
LFVAQTEHRGRFRASVSPGGNDEFVNEVKVIKSVAIESTWFQTDVDLKAWLLEHACTLCNPVQPSAMLFTVGVEVCNNEEVPLVFR